MQSKIRIKNKIKTPCRTRDAARASFLIRDKMQKRPVLDIRGLVVHRDGTLILDRLDWRVERGEHWVILGTNGSGKTSLLSTLTGCLTPGAG